MRAAADNLVPVPLELGGKCPVVAGRSADLRLAAIRVMQANMTNAGQVCMAPDTVFVPEAAKMPLSSTRVLPSPRGRLRFWTTRTIRR
jgi:acyl-CoA reductase-like NAD-dependent aldehyde dehydrogenase